MISAFLAPLYKYITGGLLIVCLALGIALKMEQRHSHKLHTQITKLSAQLQAISTARNTQKRETGERVEKAKEQIRHADNAAKTIEQAPLPGQCKTPSEILQADI